MGRWTNPRSDKWQDWHSTPDLPWQIPWLFPWCPTLNACRTLHSSLISDEEGQELSLTLITVRLLRFCATCGHLEPQKLAGSERQSVTAPIILTKAKAKELVPDVMNFSACFPLDLSKMLLLGGFTHSIRGSGNVSSIPPLPSQSCWRKLKMFHLHRGWRTCDGQQLHERARDFISGFSLGLWVPASLF